MMRIGVEGDEQMGTVEGQEVVSGITDGDGRFAATYTSGEEPGDAAVRAELMVPDNGGYRPVHDDRKIIRLWSGITYLPVIRH